MIRSRIMRTLYGLVTVWLAFCTVQTYGDVPAWSTITMAICSLIPIVAGLRESEHADELRALIARLKELTQPLAEPDDTADPVEIEHEDDVPQGCALGLTPAERAAFAEIEAHFDGEDA